MSNATNAHEYAFTCPINRYASVLTRRDLARANYPSAPEALGAYREGEVSGPASKSCDRSGNSRSVCSVDSTQTYEPAKDTGSTSLTFSIPRNTIRSSNCGWQAQTEILRRHSQTSRLEPQDTSSRGLSQTNVPYLIIVQRAQSASSYRPHDPSIELLHHHPDESSRIFEILPLELGIGMRIER